MSVLVRALTLLSHSLPLTDYYIIHEVRMCAALYVLMYIPSAEIQQSESCCLHARSITVFHSYQAVEQRSLTDAEIEKRERTREAQIATNPDFSCSLIFTTAKVHLSTIFSLFSLFLLSMSAVVFCELLQ